MVPCMMVHNQVDTDRTVPYIPTVLERSEPFPFIHIQKRTKQQDIPDWLNKPLCGGNGVNFKHWLMIDIDLDEVHPANVCAECLKQYKEDA